jgi:glycosyltransferase involved in cell wall biosynthesis
VNLDVVVPVYNEEHKLEQCVSTLRSWLKQNLRLKWQVVIADNASTDRTLQIAKDLSAQHADVTWRHLDQKGRGRALKTAWLLSTADVVTYMDVDLSTDLESFGPLVRALTEDGFDVASGSRLSRHSQVKRSVKRQILSRGYNWIVWMFFPRKTFSDTQIGFKGMTRRAADTLLPLVEDNYWFFDTELLVRAQQHGFRIRDVPVKWVEDPDSRVKLTKTSMDLIRGLVRLRFEKPRETKPAFEQKRAA